MVTPTVAITDWGVTMSFAGTLTSQWSGNFAVNGSGTQLTVTPGVANVPINSTYTAGFCVSNPTNQLPAIISSYLTPVSAYGNQIWISENNKYFTNPEKNYPVGIGTTNPQAKLHVNGDVKVDGSLNLGNQGVKFADGTIQQTAVVITNNTLQTENIKVANNITIENGGVTNFKVLPNGQMYARAVRVTVNNFPDYVFDSCYTLMSLDCVDSYIQANHHLPNVPSASEAEANGIDVAEMNKILLMKVEELTLHLIELNKEIEELKKQK